jgi:hypothetical protein
MCLDRSEDILKKHPHLFPNYLQPLKMGIVASAPVFNENDNNVQTQYTITSPKHSISPKQNSTQQRYSLSSPQQPQLQRHQSMTVYDYKYSTPWTYHHNTTEPNKQHVRRPSEPIMPRQSIKRLTTEEQRFSKHPAPIGERMR